MKHKQDVIKKSNELIDTYKIIGITEETAIKVAIIGLQMACGRYPCDNSLSQRIQNYLIEKDIKTTGEKYSKRCSELLKLGFVFNGHLYKNKLLFIRYIEILLDTDIVWNEKIMRIKHMLNQIENI